MGRSSEALNGRHAEKRRLPWSLARRYARFRRGWRGHRGQGRRNPTRRDLYACGLEEGFELRNRAKGLPAVVTPGDLVIRGQLARRDSPLELSQAFDRIGRAVAKMEPPGAGSPIGGLLGLRVHLEDMAAIRALHARPTPRQQGLVELVLGAAALAGYIHQLKSPQARSLAGLVTRRQCC